MDLTFMHVRFVFIYIDILMISDQCNTQVFYLRDVDDLGMKMKGDLLAEQLCKCQIKANVAGISRADLNGSGRAITSGY